MLGQFEDASEQDLNVNLGQIRAEIWTLQEHSAKWTNYDLEGKVNHRKSAIEGEDRRLDCLRRENDQVAMSLQRSKNEFEAANVELSSLRTQREQQVEDNDFTRNAIANENRTMREEQSELMMELESHRVLGEA